MAQESVLLVENLHKSFRVGFTRKKVHAVKGISFSVGRGEIFGFLGPNGAGKTTTMKMLMDLIRPTQGRLELFGTPPSLESRRRIGYLPEQPYFYDYLTPLELLDYFGRLHGLSKTERRGRAERLLERVGLTHAKDRTLRRFSKGMMQRAGVAQALISDPELVVLDEPLSGLDPLGRKEIKDIVIDLKRNNKTVFFSSHILADIELLCDQIAIIDKGRIRYFGPTSGFVSQGESEVEIVASGVDGSILEGVEAGAVRFEELGHGLKVLCPRTMVAEILGRITGSRGVVESVTPRSESFEEIFVRLASRSDSEVQE